MRITNGRPKLDRLVRDAVCEALGTVLAGTRTAPAELLAELKDPRFLQPGRWSWEESAPGRRERFPL
jgi:hypothetical protein